MQFEESWPLNDELILKTSRYVLYLRCRYGKRLLEVTWAI